MSDQILACYVSGEPVYFITRPQPEEQDGLLSRSGDMIPVDVWSFVSRTPAIQLETTNPYIRELWFGDTNSLTWQKEYLNHGKDII